MRKFGRWSRVFFDVEVRQLGVGAAAVFRAELIILAALRGEIQICHGAEEFALGPGGFCLLPAGLRATRVRAGTEVWKVLGQLEQIELGSSGIMSVSCLFCEPGKMDESCRLAE